MEQQYVIGVANKFAAFIDESEDPYDIIKNVEAEKLRKKALKAASTENKENKSKDDPKAKVVPRKPVAKPSDRVLAADKPVKVDNAPERANNKRNRDDGNDNSFPKTGNFRDSNRPDGNAPRGPRSDNVRGERREGTRPFRGDGEGRPFRNDGEGRPFRNDGEGRPFRNDRADGEGRPFRGDGERPFRGPRPDGENRPFRYDRDRQAGSDSESRPPRRERREFNNEGSDLEGRPERRPGNARGRGGRPPGPGRNYDNRGKREFDRRSGSDRTGVKAVDKRDGAGPYNWDSTKDAEALVSDANVTNQSDELDWDQPLTEAEILAPVVVKESEETAEEPAGPPAEEEPQELTLDEYRALRGKREKPQYDIRKPGEGEDLSQWKNMVEIKKKEQEDDNDEELEIAEFPQRAGRQRHVVGIDITFNDSFRGGRGRGRGSGPPGRGRPRENRGEREQREPREPREPRNDGPQRRFPREERKDTRVDRADRQAPKVDDEKAFPSLG